MLLESEIAEEYEVHGIEVATPNGYVPVRKVYKTKPMRVWTLTVGRFTVECSHHHLVYTLLPGGFRPACSLRPDDLVMTEDGAETVTVSADSGRVAELYDITVDRPDGMFFSNGILSHNSTTFCARQLMLACLIQGYKSLYITPYFEQLSTYGERLYEMEAQVRYDQGKQNKYLKRYPNGSKLWLSYACETADQVRGKTVGECVTGDTLVYAIEGDTTVEKRIDQLQEGDIVRTSHLDATSGMRVPATCKVQATLYKGTRKCVKVTTRCGRSVTCTPEHLFHVSGNSETWVEARNLKQGMVLHACVGGMFDLDEVDAVEQCGEYGVYDIQVADDHNFFANGILVHNCLLDECLTEDSTIICRGEKKGVDKVVRICDAAVGDWVLCPVLGTDKITYERITDKQCKGERECWTVRTERGYHVTATANHKLRSGERWVYVADILRDIGVHSIAEGDSNGEQGPDEPVCSGAAYTRSDTRNAAGRRMHSESGETRLLQTHCDEPQRGAEGVCGGEDADAERVASVMVHQSEPGIWERVQYLSFCYYHVGGVGPVLEPMLQQARSFTGWSGADAEVCVSGLGGPADLGDSGMVDSGRWVSRREELRSVHTFVFRGGSREAGSLVQKARLKQAWRCADGIRCKSCGREVVSNYPLFNSSFTESCREDSSVRTSFYGVQVGSGVTVSGLCMPGLWRRVSSYQAEVGSNEVSQRDTLSRVREEGEEGQQGAVQGASGYRGDAQALARGEAQGRGEGQEIREGVLQPQQGCDSGEAQGAQPGILPGAQRGDLREGTGEVSREGKTETIQVIHDGKLIEDRIASIAYAGRQRVWDITVEPGHVFFSNSVTNSNCQNMNPDLVPEILKTQQMSKAPMTIYSGTALSTDTLLEQQWQASSMGCYHVRSADGKHWINLHDEEELWKVCDNKEYPIDYWTGKRLNVTDGLFVHANSEAYAEGDIGLHIPMIVVPSNCEGTQWAQIYRDVKRQDPKKTLQENFGIAIGDGAREISKEDLQKICILSTSETELRRKVNSGFYRLIVMGCDWGGSDYNRAEKTKQSYTAVTVLGLAPDGGIDILYSHKYAGMDYTTIVGNLLKTYRDFKCNAIASDYGVGAVYTMLIRQHVPWQKHFVMQYSAPNTASFQRANSELANHYSVNKTEAVTNTFLAVKELRLRAGRWEDMDYYLTDFLACRRVPSESASGKKQFTWQRDPRKPDDYLHAVSFAMTLIKVYTGERVVADPSILSQIRNMLNGKPANHIDMAYIPPVVSG